MNRRHFAIAAGVGLFSFVSGCLGNGDDDPNAASSDDDSDATSPDDDRGRSSSWRDDVEFDEEVDTELYVEASSYTFEPGSDDPIRAEAGQHVGLAMMSMDSGYQDGHGLGIEGYGVQIDAAAGAVDSTTFVADEPGEFELWCTVPCGDGHFSMDGTFVVE